MSQSIILASSSKYRATLLQQLLQPLGLNFIQSAPQIDETQITGERPADMAMRLSKSKAEAVAKQHPDSIIIASDQVPYHTAFDSILRKPENQENAVAQLLKCSGTNVEFFTGLCVLNPRHAENRLQICVEQFTVKFRTLSVAEIERYVAIENPIDCAGAFKVEGLGITLFERLSGSDHNALIGLPLIRLSYFLRRCDLQMP